MNIKRARAPKKKGGNKKDGNNKRGTKDRRRAVQKVPLKLLKYVFIL